MPGTTASDRSARSRIWQVIKRIIVILLLAIIGIFVIWLVLGSLSNGPDYGADLIKDFARSIGKIFRFIPRFLDALFDRQVSGDD